MQEVIAVDAVTVDEAVAVEAEDKATLVPVRQPRKAYAQPLEQMSSIIDRRMSLIK